MTVQGQIVDGVIRLAPGVQLPEGQTVIVSTCGEKKPKGHSVLDIPAVSVGEILQWPLEYDDLLEEMLASSS